MGSIDVLTLGEAMVAFRAPGPLRTATVMDVSVAGAESNVAIGLARLGHRVRWAGRVGSDEFGAQVLRTLRAEGVLVDDSATTAQRQNGLIFFDRAPGGRTRVHYRRAGSAATELGPKDLDAAWAESPRLLHLTGITPALGSSPARAVSEAAQQARRRGGLVCLDVNYRQLLWTHQQASNFLRGIVADVHILVASEDELPLVAAGPTEADQVADLLSAGVREVVVKRGARGASTYTSDGRSDRDAVPVDVVDTVGAGDAFTAGYLSAVLDGLGVTDRLHRAVVLGAAAVASPGDWEGLPRRHELHQVEGSRQEVDR